MDTRTLQQAEQALRAGRAADARTLLLPVLAAHPGDPGVLRALVATSAALGDVEDTIDYFRRWVQRAPRPLAVLDELARYCLAHGRAGLVVDAYQTYLASHPDSTVGHFNCAWYATRQGLHELAIEHYREALALGIERPEEVHLNIANICSGALRDDARARQHLDRALEINPDYTAAWFNLGNLAEQQGQREEARRCFERCLELQPANNSALARLADTYDFTDGASLPLRQKLIAAAAASTDPDLHFAAGRSLEQAGDHARAWQHWTFANGLDRRALPAYDRAAVERRFTRIVELCSRDWLERLSSAGLDFAPVFICGMFRSGSTLLEQMLAAHPAFEPAGERDYFPRLILREFPRYPEELAGLAAAQLQKWAGEYVTQSQQIFGIAKRLTDKRPENFQYLGLIKAMFPRARIVLTRRDWRDVATSLYSTRLGPFANYATDLGDIRHYIRQHDRLVAHWRELFGGDFLEVPYEALIATPRTQLESLLGALGEPWDPACLEFHALRNTVRTASVWQVREPLHLGAVGRWQRHRERFVAAFGESVNVSEA